MSEGLLLTFDSIHDVLRAEKAMRAQGCWCDLVPTPPEISSDCGMSLAVLEQDWVGLVTPREILRVRTTHRCGLSRTGLPNPGGR